MAYPVSDRFKAALPYSHQVALKVDITDPLDFLGEEVLYSFNTLIEGEVTEDREQTSRRKGSFSVVDEDGTLTPDTAGDLLAPYGNEFRPYKGILFPDGTIEYVPQGVFGIDSNDINDSGANFNMKADGNDRSSRISRALFRDTLVVSKNTSVATAATAILAAIGYLGPTDFQGASSMSVAQKTYNIGDDPWRALVELFTNCACDVYFDETGTMISHKLRDYNEVDVDWKIEEGTEGNLLALQRQMQRDDTTANWYVVTGESAGNTTAIPFGEAFDDNPDSPTFIEGKYGVVVKHVISNTVLTDSDAADMAAHLLELGLGLSEQMISYHLPNPAMQVDDLVLVNRAKSKLTDVKVVIDQVSHPLIASRGGQSISRRRVLA